MSKALVAEPVAPPLAGARRRRYRRPPVIISLAFLVMGAVILLAVAGKHLAPFDPFHQDLEVGLQGPGWPHLLGTDSLGRDILSRVLAGARNAVMGPAVIALGAMLIGNVLGLAAGYLGGAVDMVIMRWTDLMYALPHLLVALVVVGLLGGGYWVAVGVLIFLYAPYDARIIRGGALEQRPRAYLEAARVLGLTRRRIATTHVWPNLFPYAVANTFLNFAFALVTLSALSFLGIGSGPEVPDWGRMLQDNRVYLFGNPAASLAPAVAIVITAAAANLVGDWLYERLSSGGKGR
jgi:peptide/nickel transport system permease protein